ncbi:MAG: beta-hydroxyacyl-ACP dehydratase [Planctomycetes bacterium]|nr:beta-hydroxyacyl-ACP dehydratase [Planctomycetota bacterium]
MPTAQEILDLLPQQPPFRFVDALDAIDEMSAVGHYTFRGDESFYAGHFPGNPVTPAVIITESMAQVGLVALGLYLTIQEGGLAAARSMVSLMTESQVDFDHVVRPGDTLVLTATRVYWRRKKLKSRVEARLADGTLVACGTMGGMAGEVPPLA